MNCIYRIVWNAAIGKWVVASELASGRRAARRGVALAALGLAMASTTALARDISEVLCAEVEAGQACSVPSTRNAIQADADATYLVVTAGANTTAASTSAANMIAIGSNASARPDNGGTSLGAMAIGANAAALGSDAVALGYNANANSTSFNGASGATALGASSRATWNATALGFQANATGTVVTALGTAAQATGERSVAIGRDARATAQYTTAIGRGARATHQNSVALGEGSVSRANATFAVGSTTRRRQIVEVANGTSEFDVVTVQQVRDAVETLGGGATVDASGNTVAPVYTLVNGGRQTTVGGAVAALDGSVSTLNTDITALTTRISNGDIGLVRQAAAGDDLRAGALQDGIAVQFAGTDGARRLRGVAAGRDDADAVALAQLRGSAQAAADALGGGASASNGYLVIAPSYLVDGTRHTTVGSALTGLDTRVTAQRDALDAQQQQGAARQRFFQASGIGADDAYVGGTRGVAMGSNALAGGSRVLALGASAAATGEHAIALGAGATASGENAVALGAGAKASRDNVLSVGNDTARRQIIQVGRGTERTDAVTVEQLRSAVDALGGGAHIDAATGDISGPRYAVQGSEHTTVGAALDAVDGSVVAIDARVSINEGDLRAIDRQLADWGTGRQGLVQQVDAGAAVTVAAAQGGTSVDVTGTQGARQLAGVADGSEAADAVTVAQMGTALAAAQPVAARYMAVDGAADGSDYAHAQGTGSMALGASAVASAAAATAAGQGAQASAASSVALGAGATTARANSVSVGADGAERQVVHVADGSEDTDAINLRQLRNAGLVDGSGQARDGISYTAGSQRGAVMFGGANGTVLANLGDGRLGAGSREAVNGGQIAALRDQLGSQLDGLGNRIDQLEAQGSGHGSGSAGGNGGTPPYYDAQANSVIVADGEPAQARGEGSVAAGSGAEADAANAVALGSDSLADRADTVAIGKAGGERQLTHVAAGLYETDAVNVGQLREDMASVNSYTDQRVDAMLDSMDGAMGHMQRQVNRGIAASAALIQVTPNLPGKVTLNAGVATYRGESAFGVGLSRWSRSGRYNLNAGVSASRGDQPLFNIGFGIAFD